MNTKHFFPLLLFSFLFVACTKPSGSFPTATAAAISPPTGTATLAPTAVPTPTVEPISTDNSMPGDYSLLLQDGEGQSSAWRGIGRLYGSSTCTASFIATSTDETAPAYALTNGHCIEWQANGVVTLPKYDGELIFNFFVDTQESQITVPIKRVPYRPMGNKRATKGKMVNARLGN